MKETQLLPSLAHLPFPKAVAFGAPKNYLDNFQQGLEDYLGERAQMVIRARCVS